jgi:hypothetical protein
MKKKLLIVIIVVIIGIVFVTIAQRNNKKQPAPAPQVGTPVTLQIYQDPSGYFSLLIPSNWTKSQSTTTNTSGMNTPNYVVQDVDITQFSMPPDKSVTIKVYKGQPACPFAMPINSNFAGFPAAYEETGHQWSIPTTDATVVIGVSYPGSETLPGSPSTTIPQPIIDANKKLFNEILSNFQLNSLQPLQCY